MILPGTYANGFAPRDGQPLYPELWKGCVGAWNPGLGVSGLTLRDWGGFGFHGTLTNGPTWAASSSKYALDFDNTNDFVNLGSKNALTPSNSVTLSWWENVTSSAGTYQSRFMFSQDGGTRSLLVFRSTQSDYQNISVVGASFGNNFTKSIDVPSIASAVGVWLHWCLVQPLSLSNTSHAWQFWVNGFKYTTSAGYFGSSFGNTGNRIGLDTCNDDPANCKMDDVRLYTRALSPQEIRLLASRRGIAYEMAPRRRSQAQVTTNRRRRIIIGGNR